MSKRKTLTGHVRRAFEPAELIDACKRTDFSMYADKVELPGHDRFYWYADNGSDVLAIAHLDSVQSNPSCTVVDTAAGQIALSGVLDDRLGVYVVLDLLPALGVECDWLLTTDEERGQSTATEFSTDKEYNWMFSFDRGGTDVVMYDYETPELVDLVEASGSRVGIGSYSDICDLEHLGCAGFNWGVGYQDYHGPRGHAWLEDTFRMVGQFVRFYRANAATRLEHNEPWVHCQLCGEPFVVDRWSRWEREQLCVDCQAEWDELMANGGYSFDPKNYSDDTDRDEEAS